MTIHTHTQVCVFYVLRKLLLGTRYFFLIFVYLVPITDVLHTARTINIELNSSFKLPKISSSHYVNFSTLNDIFLCFYRILFCLGFLKLY